MPATTFKQFSQKILLSLYKRLHATGILSSSFGQFLLRHCYFAYKTLVEAGPVSKLQNQITPGSWVIDVGANIGFFSIHFSRWVSNGGKVLAIEPEPGNCRQLARNLRKTPGHNLVEILQLAADNRNSEAKLAINPVHPGDHRLSTRGITVQTRTVDDIMAERNNPPVSLIKIDVQGAEQRVLQGAAATIRRCRPALFVEVDETTLRGFDTCAEDILSLLVDAGYAIHTLEQGRQHTLPEALRILAARRYTDFLFLPDRGGEKSIQAAKE